jgi:hypothetical protein
MTTMVSGPREMVVRFTFIAVAIEIMVLLQTKSWLEECTKLKVSSSFKFDEINNEPKIIFRATPKHNGQVRSLVYHR